MSITDISNDISNAAGTGPSTAAATPLPELRLVAFDLYRDIHKGIRSELFAVTSTAGSVDPADALDRAALADHVTSVAAVLESHAHHEDDVIDPVLELHHPELSEQIRSDHHALEARFAFISELAGEVVTAPAADARRLSHLLYLELSGFTSAYLAHQLVEERVVMPALELAVGVPAVVDMHVAIVSSIPPDEMMRSLAFMLPAMNVDDRAELLGGMRQGAPAEAFAAVVSLARSVLRPGDFGALAARLGL